MGVVHHDSIHIDVCRCGGMWFDAGELVAWRKGLATSPIVSRVQGSTAMPCPRCPTAHLLAHTVATVPVRACPTCRGAFVPAESVARLEPATNGASGAETAGSILGGVLEVVANALFFL